MAQNASASTRPLFLAHWDVDLYPRQSRLIVEELLLHILLHGEVLVKEVDLLHNPAIRGTLSETGVRTQFQSLLKTGRVKVLLPPRESTKFAIDPLAHPLTAVAQERDNKRPHKFRIWRFTEPYRRYCAMLDPIIRDAHAVRFRAPYPEINDFAATLYRILKDQSWRQREEFKGIDKMTDRFAEYCLDPELAVRDLETAGVAPLEPAFYRSNAYRCVRLERFGSSWRRQRAMRTLLQSVYAECERAREQAVSTYHARLPELPLPLEPSDTSYLSGLETIAPLLDIHIPVAANIGEILTSVINDCPQIKDVWAMSGQDTPSPMSPDYVAEVYAAIADAFARHAFKASTVQWSPRAEAKWQRVEQIHRIIFLINVLSIVLGVAFVRDFEGPIIIAEGLAVFAQPLMKAICTGQAYDGVDTQRDTVRRVIFDTLRSGAV